MIICIFLSISVLSLLSIKTYINNGKRVTSELFIIILYGISIFGSLFLDKKNEDEYSIEATSYFLTVFLITVYPILSFKSGKIKTIFLVKRELTRVICIIFIILGLVSILFFIPTLWQLINSPSSILVLRTDLVGGERYNEVNFIYYIVTLYSQFYPIVILFYFLSVSKSIMSNKLNFLLLLSSMSYIFNVLTSVGRDGFVLWSMSYVFTYLLFKPFLNKKERKRQSKIFQFFAIIFIVVFSVITISRFFSESNSQGFMSLLSYSSQQFGYFNTHFNKLPPYFEGANTFSDLFPLMKLGESSNLSFLELNSLYQFKYKFDPNVFTTYIGDFYFHIGFIKTLFFFTLLSFCVTFILKCKTKSVVFGKLIIFTLYSQIPLHGFFYYKLNYTVSNIYILLVVLLSILFSFKFKVRHVSVK